MHEPGKHVSPLGVEWDQLQANGPLGESHFGEADLDSLLVELKAPDEVCPSPGFYARVMDRIESQRSPSIWSVFLEPLFGRRLAMASGLLMLLLGAALFLPNSEVDDALRAQGKITDSAIAREDGFAPVLASGEDRDQVLVNLVTYQEH